MEDDTALIETREKNVSHESFCVILPNSKSPLIKFRDDALRWQPKSEKSHNSFIVLRKQS